LEDNSILTEITEKNTLKDKDDQTKNKNLRRSILQNEDPNNKRNKDISPGTELAKSGLNSVIKNVTRIES
jgi:hypothetical protein